MGQEGCATLADELALRHYADAVAEDLSFIHVMCSQNDHTVFFVRLEHIPHASAGCNVKTSGRLIE